MPTSTLEAQKTETKVMPARAQIIDSIKTRVLGVVGQKADLRELFYHYRNKVDFFKIGGGSVKRNCIGFHLPKDKYTEGHIFLVHNSLENIEKNITNGGPKNMKPDVVITIRKERRGTLQALLHGEGSDRIDIMKLDASFKPLVFNVLEEGHRAIGKYNLRKLRELRNAEEK